VVSADENALIAPTFKPMASSAPQQLIMCSATKQSLEVSQLLSSGGNICVPCQQLNVIVANPASLPRGATDSREVLPPHPAIAIVANANETRSAIESPTLLDLRTATLLQQKKQLVTIGLAKTAAENQNAERFAAYAPVAQLDRASDFESSVGPTSNTSHVVCFREVGPDEPVAVTARDGLRSTGKIAWSG